MPNNVAVGLLRPPHIFFYEVDLKNNDNFGVMKYRLIRAATAWFNKDSFSIYRTKHGYHLIAYPYSRRAWNYFKRKFPSDFTRKLKSRWGKKEPQVLRISEKFDVKTGKVVSPAPKRIYGNYNLYRVMPYKVIYFAK